MRDITTCKIHQWVRTGEMDESRCINCGCWKSEFIDKSGDTIAFNAGMQKGAREVAELFAQLCRDYATPTGSIYASDIMCAMESYINRHYRGGDTE